MRTVCIIPTYNGKSELERLLTSLKIQTAHFETCIVDSGSTDGTQELAREHVENVTVISPFEFNHGGTRQRMVDQNPGYDIYVFLTQDACLANTHAIANIVEPFTNPEVGAVCGRQLPHLDATHLAKHARFFNYPEGAEIKSTADIARLGIKATFISNSFSAYRGEALKAVGGFPLHVISTEDMYATAKMLLAGWKMAYAGNAQCRHSHNYSIVDEFKRYFDIGVFHAREPWIRKKFGSAGSEGIRYLKSELRFLGLGGWHLWPNSIVRNVVKLIGYKLGQQEAKLPIGFKRTISMSKRYWDGPFAHQRSSASR